MAAPLPAAAVLAIRQESLYHEARVLILISEFTAPGAPFRGLTKLAKVDFLLRYPVMAERLLPGGTTWQDSAPTADERQAVESRMIRYKYGPWDDRYYPLLGALVGKRLATFARVGGSMEITLTEAGRDLSIALGETSSWAIVAERARFLREHFDLPGQELKDLIYEQLPDVVALPLRSEI
ncbi:hypothetical protein AB0F81_29615 [Actinoplanes sp. NPDC024001]|uniref:hypothetical protein n=1 Tax=Actinoplanes sp. NPDC024001 TaxID=3154598 RepID=UPI0033EDC1D6